MPDPVHSHHVTISEEHELLSRGAHDTRGPGSLSVSVINELAGLLNVDPTATPLHLDDCIDSDWLDQLPNRHSDHDTNSVGICFHYGDYKVFACSCGKIAVYGDLAKHERGEMETPHSMKNYASINHKVEMPDHDRRERPSPTRRPRAD